MHQKEVLLIVGVLVVGFFLFKQNAFSSANPVPTTGNAIQTTCEDPCKAIVAFLRNPHVWDEQVVVPQVSLGDSCSNTLCNTCSYYIGWPNKLWEVVTLSCILHHAHVDSRWITPLEYSSPNQAYWSWW